MNAEAARTAGLIALVLAWQYDLRLTCVANGNPLRAARRGVAERRRLHGAADSLLNRIDRRFAKRRRACVARAR